MLSAQDVLTDTDHRVEVFPSNIDKKGFDLCIKTWLDTEVWSVCASWFAYEASREENGILLSGKQSFTSQTPQWRLDKGQGNRVYTRTVSFDVNFGAPPEVFVALSQLDVSNDTDLRLSVQANNIKRGSFDLVVSTWSDTRVYGCNVTWLAFDASYSEPKVHKLNLHQGEHSFKKTDAGYTMLQGEGDRFMKFKVNIPRRYQDNPSVLVALSQLDIEREKDHRCCACAENVSAGSFDIKVNTWKDTRVWSATARWLSHGTADVKKEKEEEEEAKKKKEEEKKKKEEKKHALAEVGEDDEPDKKKQKKEEEEDEEAKECKICFDAEINTVIVPCGHLCVCEPCSKLITKDKNARCPICKQAVQKIVKTFKT